MEVPDGRAAEARAVQGVLQTTPLLGRISSLAITPPACERPSYIRRRQDGSIAFPYKLQMQLLAFPAEIRFKIYAELLVGDDPIEFSGLFGWGWDLPRLPFLRTKRHGLNPNLLRANKAISKEATPLLY